MVFPSKILLFGEYGLVVQGSGFALPYFKYSGAFQFEPEDNAHLSSQSIQAFFSYLKNRKEDFQFLDLPALQNDLELGLWFKSNIPGGYGLGSSGALVAALYQRYQKDNESDVHQLKHRLASMESYFHGFSSGVDPLVSLLQKPSIIHNTHRIETLSSWKPDALGYSIYLVDTGSQSKTLSLVDWFKSRLQKENFRLRTELDFLNVNTKIISDLQNGHVLEMSDLLTLSRYQLDYLSPMVPENFRQHFFAGLESGDFAFKLCGSGGGGFMLCFTRNTSKTIAYLEQNNLIFEKLI